MNSVNHPTPQESGQPGQTVAELIQDMRELALALDSFSLSFKLAWRRTTDSQHQPSRTTITAPPQERTSP